MAYTCPDSEIWAVPVTKKTINGASAIKAVPVEAIGKSWSPNYLTVKI